MPSPILLPVVALVLWSLVMEVWLYATRIPAIQAAYAEKLGARLREAGLTQAAGVAKENVPASKFLYPKFNATSSPYDFTPLVPA